MIESKAYFLEVCRYVHRNPEKANINKTENYKWSSYNDYISGKGITSTDLLLHYFNNNITDFIKYTLKAENLDDISNMADFEIINKLTDEMLKCAAAMEFEKAAEIRDRIKELEGLVQ